LVGHTFPETSIDSLGKLCCDSHDSACGVVATFYVVVPHHKADKPYTLHIPSGGIYWLQEHSH
jgi:hypothetical protein